MASEPMTRPDGPCGYEVVEHTADWALRVRGANFEELLINAARGMSSLLVSDLDALGLETERTLALDAFDAETLLVDWLTELAYWAESESIVFADFSLRDVTETHLAAVMRGSHVPELLKHIKAVTYHDLEIVKTDTGLTATVVFDV